MIHIRQLFGGKHPHALGSPAAEVWKEIWGDIEPMLKQVMENDTGTYVESQLLIMERYGYKEETYYTFSYTPVLGDDLKPAGMICYNTADSERILNERALQTLRQLDSLIQKKSEQEVYKQTAVALSTNTRDFPFAIIYKVEHDGSKAEAIAYSGIDAANTELPLKVDLEVAETKARNVATAIRENRIVLSKNDGRWKDLPKGSWDIMPDNYVHIPIKAANKNYPLAVLTLGLNPYRKFDNAYRNFIQQIADQVTLNVNDALAYEEERKRKEALEEIDRAKTIFFTNISHEFRTPLTLMLGTIEEAIKDPETTESNLDKLNVAQRNALRLLKLVNTLLDFSRIESGRQKANYALTDISLLTKNLAANFQSIIEKAGLKFTVQAHSIPGDVYVDKQMWEKIVFNLLSNAFKYTLEGSIAVELFAEKNNVVLKIKDTGVGIPEKELSHMFERFHRVQNTVGRTYEGTGIGLSLIKELVQLHDGTISVESKEGEGSVFIVAIPFGKDHLPASQTHNSSGDIEDILPDVYIEEINSFLAEDKILPIGKDNSEQLASVLVVDDNTDMLQHLKSLLQKHYRVITAENGEDALKKIKTQKPLLVLSDIMMPVLDGIQLLKEIKSNIETAHIPVVLLTARAGEESRIEGYEIGADDYLVKPFSAKELLARVRSQIKIANTKRHLQSQLRDFFMEAPASIGVVRGPKHVWEIVNKRMLELSGRERVEDLLGKPIFESVPESRGQGYEQIFDKVYNTGERIILNEAPVEIIRKGEKEKIYTKLLFEPLHEEDGTISGVMFLADDITEQVEARKKIEESERELQQLFKEAPVTIVVYSGNNFIVRVANAIALEMWGKTEEEVLNKPFFEISPELEHSQGALLKRILETGEVFTGKELHVEFLRHGTLYSGYFDFVYQPHFNSAKEITGVIAIGTEVTHSVIARKKIEESESRFRGHGK
jgi:PAS domain S-box-containing protein